MRSSCTTAGVARTSDSSPRPPTAAVAQLRRLAAPWLADRGVDQCGGRGLCCFPGAGAVVGFSPAGSAQAFAPTGRLRRCRDQPLCEGMAAGDIANHLSDVYGTEVARDLVRRSPIPLSPPSRPRRRPSRPAIPVWAPAVARLQRHAEPPSPARTRPSKHWRDLRISQIRSRATPSDLRDDCPLTSRRSSPRTSRGRDTSFRAHRAACGNGDDERPAALCCGA